MTSIELLNFRAASDAVIVMTLQEWRDLCDEVCSLPFEDQVLYDEALFNRSWLGKLIEVGTEPA